MLIIKKAVDEKDAKSYFKPPLIDVYESFYYDSEIFDEEVGPFREDYPYLRILFKKWDMRSLCDSLFKGERVKKKR